MNLGGREACASAPRRGQDRGLRRSPLCHSALSPPVPPGSALERAVPGCIEFLFVTTSAVCSREIARVLLWLAAFLWCNSWPSQSIAGAPRAERWIVTGKALGIKKKKKTTPHPPNTTTHTASGGSPREAACSLLLQALWAGLFAPQSLGTRPSSHHFQSRSFR